MKSLLSYALLALTLTGCDFSVYGSERAGCEGHPEFLRTLPDTTISLSGGPVVIPIDRDEPLAYHTGGQSIVYDANSSGFIVSSYIVVLNGKYAVTIVPLEVGATSIWIGATDDCEVRISTRFGVTVEP